MASQDANVEVVAASGQVRVTVCPNASWPLIALEAVFIILFSTFAFRAWPTISLFYRAVLAWAVVGAVVAWFYQLSGSEVIEFDAQKLTIHKEILGYPRNREYRMEDCSELAWRQRTRGNRNGLKCKVGWRTITFGEYVSENQTDEIVAALQKELPHVSEKLGITLSTGVRHFTTLGLN